MINMSNNINLLHFTLTDEKFRHVQRLEGILDKCINFVASPNLPAGISEALELKDEHRRQTPDFKFFVCFFGLLALRAHPTTPQHTINI